MSAPAMVPKRNPVVPAPLVGKWFLTLDAKGTTNYQGNILAKLDSGYLVQFYEWILGEPTDQRIVPEADMVGWSFYDTNEDMRFEYKYVRAPRDLQIRKEAAAKGAT